MKMIVGLGNPGLEYENTRHNVGFMVLNYFPGNINKEKFNALYTKLSLFDEDVLFVKPLTYMNLSGDAVGEFARYFKISNDDILIIQDDLDLEFATIKLKYKSSAGGHNGMKSIISHLGTDEVPRLKIGISHDRSMDTVDYVLHKFSKAELEKLDSIMPTVKKVIETFIKSGINVNPPINVMKQSTYKGIFGEEVML